MTEIRRTKKIAIRVTDDIFERLEKVALTLGQAPSTLASIALSDYLTQKERQLGFMDSVAGTMGEAFKQDMGKILGIVEVARIEEEQNKMDV